MSHWQCAPCCVHLSLACCTQPSPHECSQLADEASQIFKERRRCSQAGALDASAYRTCSELPRTQFVAFVAAVGQGGRLQGVTPQHREHARGLAFWVARKRQQVGDQPLASGLPAAPCPSHTITMPLQSPPWLTPPSFPPPCPQGPHLHDLTSATRASFVAGWRQVRCTATSSSVTLVQEITPAL